MNEELKIIIRAVTDEAKKNIAAVRKELEGVDDEAKAGGKTIGEVMKGIAASVAATIGVVVALTAAMAKLGQTAQEVQKGFDKLNATFQSNGFTTKQAAQTYKELFSFLGDHDKAIETAQSIALIASSEEEATKWTKTLQGAFAEMGDKLPIEGLAEAANESANVGQVVGVLADALTWAGISEDGFNLALAETNSLEERQSLILNTLNGLYGNSAQLYDLNAQATKRYNESQANLNIALSQAAGYTTPLLTSLNELSIALLVNLGPAFETVAAYLTAFIQLLAEAVSWVGNFFGVIGGATGGAKADIEGYTAAYNKYLDQLRNGFKVTNSETDKSINKIKELKKQTMGFDELNIVSSQTATSSGAAGGGGGGGVTIPKLDAPNPADYGLGGDYTSGITKGIEEAKEKIKAILVLVQIIGGAIALWAAGTALFETIRAIKLFMGEGLSFIEAVKALPEYGKAFYDGMKGVDGAWDKLINKLKLIGGWIMIIAGAVLLVQGFSDAWINGLDWQNMLETLSGIALIVGGIALAFGPFAAAIALTVGGVVALVLGIKDLIENGYSMEGVLMVLAGALAVGIGLVWALNAALLANPITWIIVAIVALVAAIVILWNECEWFRNAVTAAFDWIVNAFKVAIDWIVNAFKAVVSFFKDNWQALLLLLVNPFAGAFKLLYDNCDGFREFIDKWVKKIAQFFKDLVGGIKNTFSGIGQWFSDIFSKIGATIGDKIGGAVKGAINGVLSFAVKTINGFLKAINFAIDIINAIPGVDIKKLKMLEVPKLARGGIATSSTLANIGENGREAILPLENNTGWMDTLADRIASRNNTPSKLVLMLDGKELGYATINSINDITRQTGSLQLAF